MNPVKPRKALVYSALLAPLCFATGTPDSSTGLTWVRSAHAVVGAPLTPLSVAGVARRTTRHAVVAGSATAASTAQQQQAVAQQQAATAQQQAAVAQQQAAASAAQPASKSPATSTLPAGAPAIGTVVSALPAGCVPETRDGVAFQKCGGVLYRAAFQGSNLVYVVQ